MKAAIPRCTDCNATFRRGRMDHAKDCPLIAQCDRDSDGDKAFFAKNPKARSLDRRATSAEREMIRLSHGFEPYSVNVRRMPNGAVLHGYRNASGAVGAMGVVA